MQQFYSLAAPLGRVLISLIFVMSGLNKVFNYGAAAGWMEAMGVPGTLLPLVILLEVIGGLAIIVGWHARWFALALAGFCALSALIFHANFADQNEMNNFMKNIAIAGGFLFIFASGAGAYSWGRKKPAE